MTLAHRLGTVLGRLALVGLALLVVALAVGAGVVLLTAMRGGV